MSENQHQHLFEIPAGFDQWAGHSDLIKAAGLMQRCQIDDAAPTRMTTECYDLLGQMIADIINWRKTLGVAAEVLLKMKADLDAANARKEPDA